MDLGGSYAWLSIAKLRRSTIVATSHRLLEAKSTGSISHDGGLGHCWCTSGTLCWFAFSAERSPYCYSPQTSWTSFVLAQRCVLPKQSWLGLREKPHRIPCGE